MTNKDVLWFKFFPQKRKLSAFILKRAQTQMKKKSSNLLNKAANL